MANNQSLKEYYKYCVFAFIFGFGGSVWGGMTYFLGIPVAYLSFLKASPTQIGLITAIFWAGFAFPQVWAAYKSESLTIKKISCRRNLYIHDGCSQCIVEHLDFPDSVYMGCRHRWSVYSGKLRIAIQDYSERTAGSASRQDVCHPVRRNICFRFCRQGNK